VCNAKFLALASKAASKFTSFSSSIDWHSPAHLMIKSPAIDLRWGTLIKVGGEHEKHATALIGHRRTSGLGDWVRVHGHQLRLWPADDPTRRYRSHPRRRGRRRDALRYRRNVRAVHQRGDPWRGARADSRTRGDRDKVRPPH